MPTSPRTGDRLGYPASVNEVRVSNREAIVGLTGLALCRSLISGPPDQSRSRIEELRALLTAEDADWDGAPLPELDPRAGYALWAAVYDLPGNQLRRR
jgi:hypothetical protein